MENEDEILDIHLLEDIINILEEELLFPVFEMILHGRRLQRIQNFLATVHAKSHKEFREDFRIHRGVTYLLLRKLVLWENIDSICVLAIGHSICMRQNF